MALTEIGICKLALSRLRDHSLLPNVSTVAELEADSTAAQELIVWYSTTLLELLELTAWQPSVIFAELTQLEAADGTQPWAGKWDFSFAYPEDCAVVRAVSVPGDGRKLIREREYAISNNVDGFVIYSDFDLLNIEYVQDLPDASLYGRKAAFCKALAMQLAWNIAPGLGVSEETRKSVALDYQVALTRLVRISENESESGHEPPGDWVAARAGG